MKICPHCSQPVDDDRETCPMCNQPITATEPKEVEQQKVVAAVPKERPLLTILKKLGKTKQFWMLSFYIVAGFLVLFWGTRAIATLFEKKEIVEQIGVVEPGLRKQLDAMIENILSEKLEWGREILKHRLPSRFPDELVLDTKKANAEVRYDTEERNSIYYEFLVCFHFEDDVKLTYTWKPITFFFELRNGQWEMIGEKWLRNSDLDLE